MASIDTQTDKGGAKAARFPLDWREWLASEAARPALLILLGVAVAYWSFWPALYDLFQSPDGYYSHGFLVPLIAAFIVYRCWPLLKAGDWLWFLGGFAKRLYEKNPKLQGLKAKPFWPALLLLPAVLLFNYASTLLKIEGFQSVGLLALLLVGIWFVAGGRWMVALSLPVLYLAFALPLWTTFINNTTNPLQVASTTVAYHVLRLLGFDPYQSDPTIIQLNHFTLDVGVPCSGLKLLLALTAFTVFFILIARLNWVGNLVMAALIVPLSLLINGLRVALIGMVGDHYGPQAGHAFHDYSGYITLIICFFVVFKIARLLGWKE